MSGLLEIRRVTRKFGGLVANNDISFNIGENEILSVIGPNGAGKSTLFKIIASFLPATSGEVLFRGARISGLKPHIRGPNGGRADFSGNHDLQVDVRARKRRRGPAPAFPGDAGGLFLGYEDGP